MKEANYEKRRSPVRKTPLVGGVSLHGVLKKKKMLASQYS